MRSALSGLAAIFAMFAAVFFYGHWKDTKDMPSQSGADGTVLREIKGCSRELAWTEPSKIASVVKTGSMLNVVILANENCGPVRAVSPTVVRSEQNLTLGWSWWVAPKSPMAACKCTRHLEFVVPNITSDNPTVTISLENLSRP